MFSYTGLSLFLLAALSNPSAHAFTPAPFVRKANVYSNGFKSSPIMKKESMVLNMVDPSFIVDQCSSSELLAYSDDPLGDLLTGVNGAVVAGILGTVVAIGIGFTALLPKVGAAKFTLTPEEEDAVSRVESGYDAKDWERELTEEGTKGYVNRKRQANEAKEKYQDGKLARDVKDRSLRYSEANLGFIACLVRAADPNPGDVLAVLGSGAGRSTLGSAAVFPGFKKCIGIEFLPELVKLSNGYKGKVRGKKAPVEFVNADFAEYDLSGVDIVFATATYFNNGDLEAGLSTLPSGAKVMIIDKRLGAGFKLISQVEDPSGDLVLNTGYVFEKI